MNTGVLLESGRPTGTRSGVNGNQVSHIEIYTLFVWTEVKGYYWYSVAISVPTTNGCWDTWLGLEPLMAPSFMLS